jgi:hypothetical protein
VFGEGDLRLHFAGIGVKDIAEPAGGSFDGFAAYEMADFTHGSHSSGSLTASRKGRLVVGRYFVVIFTVFSQRVTS